MTVDRLIDEAERSRSGTRSERLFEETTVPI
jgi:hypothetical protein